MHSGAAQAIHVPHPGHPTAWPTASHHPAPTHAVAEPPAPPPVLRRPVRHGFETRCNYSARAGYWGQNGCGLNAAACAATVTIALRSISAKASLLGRFPRCGCLQTCGGPGLWDQLAFGGPPPNGQNHHRLPRRRGRRSERQAERKEKRTSEHLFFQGASANAVRAQFSRACGAEVAKWHEFRANPPGVSERKRLYKTACCEEAIARQGRAPRRLPDEVRLHLTRAPRDKHAS